MKTKICNKCGRELPLDSDHFNHKCDTKDGVHLVSADKITGRTIKSAVKGRKLSDA